MRTVRRKWLMTCLGMVAWLVAAAGAPAADAVLKGDAVCTRCHDESETYPVLSIGKTKHGTVADGRTPTCTSCHGESTAHVENKKAEGDKSSGRAKPDRTFDGPLPSLRSARVENHPPTEPGKRSTLPAGGSRPTPNAT